MPSLRKLAEMVGWDEPTRPRRWKAAVERIRQGASAMVELDEQQQNREKGGVVRQRLEGSRQLTSGLIQMQVLPAIPDRLDEQHREMMHNNTEFFEQGMEVSFIAFAMAEGYTLEEISNSRSVHMRMSGKVAAAQYRHGPKSQEVQDAIDEANRVGALLTNARAELARNQEAG